MLTFIQVKNNPQILEFIRQTEISLKVLGYTEHGLDHVRLVADRARNVAKEIGLIKREQELVTMAAFCHDMGNFLGRTQHHYWGSLLFHQVFAGQLTPWEMATIMQAIVNHDKNEMKLSNKISAVLILADKSDVRRERVIVRRLERIRTDIHDRVNYAVTDSKLKIDKNKKKIILTLKIDTKFVPVMEFFEIFTERMTYCRQAAKYLGYRFSLIINNFKLL